MNLIKIWGLFLSVTLVAQVALAHLVVKKIMGKAFEVSNSKVKKQLSKNLKLTGDIEIESNEGAKVLLEFASGDQILLYPTTHIFVDKIQGLNSFKIDLKRGQLKWASKTTSDGPGQHVVLQTPLIEAEISPSEFVISYQPELPRTEMWVMQGSMNFHILQSTEGVLLRAHQKGFFQGLFEDKEIAYDFLLKDKKVPKGLISAAIDFEEKDSKQFAVDWNDKFKKAGSQSKESKNEVGIICQKPKAKFNECAWECVGLKKSQKVCQTNQLPVQCVRRKCDANGSWTDEFILSADAGLRKCQKTVVVGACDY